jgi:hypothetical protein
MAMAQSSGSCFEKPIGSGVKNGWGWGQKFDTNREVGAAPARMAPDVSQNNQPRDLNTAQNEPRKPNRRPQKSKANKKLRKLPDAKQKSKPRELNEASSLPPLKQKTTPAKQKKVAQALR